VLHVPSVESNLSDVLLIKKSDYKVLPRRFRSSCRAGAVVIDRFDLWRNGAYAVWFEEGAIRVENSLQYRGRRPWTNADPTPKPKREQDDDIRVSKVE